MYALFVFSIFTATSFFGAAVRECAEVAVISTLEVTFAVLSGGSSAPTGRSDPPHARGSGGLPADMPRRDRGRGRPLWHLSAPPSPGLPDERAVSAVPVRRAGVPRPACHLPGYRGASSARSPSSKAHGYQAGEHAHARLRRLLRTRRRLGVRSRKHHQRCGRRQPGGPVSAVSSRTSQLSTFTTLSRNRLVKTRITLSDWRGLGQFLASVIAATAGDRRDPGANRGDSRADGQSGLLQPNRDDQQPSCLRWFRASRSSSSWSPSTAWRPIANCETDLRNCRALWSNAAGDRRYPR